MGLDRVAREPEAEGLALAAQALAERPGLCFGKRHRLGFGGAAEEPALPGDEGVGRAGGGGHQQFGGREDAGTLQPETVEGAGRRKRLHLAAVQRARIDAVDEIVEAAEGPVGGAFGADVGHRAFADALQRAECVADGDLSVLIFPRRRRRQILEREIGRRGIDAGPQQRHAEAAQVVNQHAELVGQVDIVGHGAGVEGGRVVRFQPGGLPGDEGIGGRVAFVEAVAGELVDQVEDELGLGPGHAVGLGTLDEAGALRVHLGLDLLAHGAPEQIGLAQRVAGEHLRDLHHLLLVDDDAVGGLQYGFEHGVQVIGLLPAPFAGGEAGDIVHRARPVEGAERDDVLEDGRLYQRERAAHAFGFELEHADRVAPRHQRIDPGIVPGQRVEVDLGATRLKQLLRAGEDGERFQAQEVELHEARFLGPFEIELGDREVRARIAVKGHELGERPVADDDAGGVGGGVAGAVFQLQADLDEACDLGVGIHLGGEFGNAVQRALQVPRVGGAGGDQVRQPVHLPIGQLHHAADILDNRAGLQCSEGDDLRDLLAAILRLHVADHLFAAGFAEVDVEIGHRAAFGVEEAFEQQAERERIEIGDEERPGDRRTRARTPAGAHRDPLRLCPLDEIGDDQEIARKAHVADDLELEGEPVPVGLLVDRPLFRQRRQAPPQPVLGQPHQFGLLGPGVGHQLGQDGLALLQREGRAAGDMSGHGQRLGQIGEAVGHLGRGRQIMARVGALAIGRLEIGALRDTEHHVVRGMAGRLQEAGRVGCDDRQPFCMGERQEAMFARLFDRVAGAGDFDEQPVAEQLLQAPGELGGLVGLPLCQQAGERAVRCARQCKQAFGAAGQPVELALPFHVCSGDEAEQVLPAGLVLGVEDEVVDRRLRTGAQASGRERSHDRQHGADDRLDAFVHAGFGKGHGRKQRAAICKADRRQAALRSLPGERLHLDGRFEHRETALDPERNDHGWTVATAARWRKGVCKRFMGTTRRTGISAWHH